ncbi:MAG TPA: efflux RND transporter permease subunit [Gaiellaceae bacterium]|nr:efflux RND transporter permease subunit [Gaiellaceae bacterium]
MSLKFRLLVVALATATLVVGVSQLRDMPVDVLPEFVPPTVEIQTEALGLSAAEVEQLITVPMEQDLLVGVAFLDDIRSESLPGLSRIFLVFEPGTDLYRARQVVAERMTQAHALPNVSKPPQMLQPLSSTNRVMIVGASTKNLSPIEMGVLARWTIAPRLIGVEGVANVSVWGFRDRQLQVQVDPERLRAQDVGLVQVIESAGNALWFSPLTFVEASTPGTGGFIDTPNQRLGIQHLSPINSAEDLAKVRLEDTGARNLTLGDVASVVEDHQPLIGDANVSGGDGDLLFVVEKLPEANTLEVTKGLESTIASMAPGLAGVELDTNVYRPASFIDTAIENLTLALIVGGVLLALVLGAFFFRFRAALIALVVIPISLVAAALVLWLLGTTMNAIILVGLIAALAFAVDDGVIGVENVARRLREHGQKPNGKSTTAVIFDATLESRGVTTYATLIVALAVLPVFFLNGLAGSFFPDLAGAFLLALLASMVVAMTVTPALAILLLPRVSFERESPVAGWLHRGYGSALAWVVHRPRWAYLAAGAFVVAACASLPFMSTSLLPTFKEEQLLIRWDGAPGTSLPEMNRITALASRELRSVEGVADVGAHVGRAVGSDLSANANTAEMWVSIDTSADYDATVAAIKDVASGYPGLSQSIQAFSNERAKAVLSDTGTTRDVVVRLYGEDPDVLRTQAERVRGVIGGVDGIADASVDFPVTEPTVEVEVDLAKADAKGIKPGDVRRAAATLLGGINVGNLFEQQKVFEVVVWGTPETRNSLSSIQQLLIETPDGRRVRLGDVADVRIAADPTVVERHAVSRYLDIGATVSGRDRDSVVQDVESRLAEMQFPIEYTTDVLAESGQPTGRLIGLAIGALVGIFLLLQACFGSWRLATLCFLSFPAAVTGAVLTVAIVDGGALTFGSAIAIFAVLGIAVRNGMLLIERLRQLQRDEPFGPELVLRGAGERVGPVLMTALASSLALMPFVVRGEIAGYELAHSLAVVLIGGLVTATLLTLFVVPVVYLGFGASAVPESETPATSELMADRAPHADSPAPAGVAMKPNVQPEPST